MCREKWKRATTKNEEEATKNEGKELVFSSSLLLALAFSNKETASEGGEAAMESAGRRSEGEERTRSKKSPARRRENANEKKKSECESTGRERKNTFSKPKEPVGLTMAFSMVSLRTAAPLSSSAPRPSSSRSPCSSPLQSARSSVLAEARRWAPKPSTEACRSKTTMTSFSPLKAMSRPFRSSNFCAAARSKSDSSSGGKRMSRNERRGRDVQGEKALIASIAVFFDLETLPLTTSRPPWRPWGRKKLNR